MLKIASIVTLIPASEVWNIQCLRTSRVVIFSTLEACNWKWTFTEPRVNQVIHPTKKVNIQRSLYQAPGLLFRVTVQGHFSGRQHLVLALVRRDRGNGKPGRN